MRIITGCGRSGTKYMAYLLQKHGLDMPHEKLGKDGIVDWTIAANTKKKYPRVEPYNRISIRKGATILHQVRHPLKVISSVRTISPPAWELICRNSECRMDDPMLLRCTKYYYYWNLMAEDISSWTYQIEKIDDIFKELCKKLKIKPNHKALKELPRNINRIEITERRVKTMERNNYKPLVWNDLDSKWVDRIKEMAERYGYIE